MATKSPRFDSKYTDKKVTAAQWAAERMCERRAAAEGLGPLPPQFWKQARWLKFFRQQVTYANGMVKDYGHEPLISLLKDKEFNWGYSLGSPPLMKAVAKRATLLKARGNWEAEPTTPLPPPPAPAPDPPKCGPQAPPPSARKASVFHDLD
jgi:hypothetical protein